jgi:L-alanine-DL-glutamate epimerase-like enolase superfamily enzyme
MLTSDIRITDFSVAYSQETYRIPFSISSGTISEITYAQISITAENRRKTQAVGRGGVLLSDLWSFPDSSLSHSEKDDIMRRLVEALGSYLINIHEFLDPLQIDQFMNKQMEKIMSEVAAEYNIYCTIPRLCILVCWSAIDAATHDVWAKANGMKAYDMYHAQYLNDDLSNYLGRGWERMYPQQFLVKPTRKLSVQHVVGGLDPLTSRDIINDPQLDHIPNTLEQWIEKEGLNWFKLKIKGVDVDWDLSRIVDVYRVAESTIRNQRIRASINITLDPNEACPSPEPMIETLLKLKEDYPEIFASLRYIEQPTHRDLQRYSFTLHNLARIKPVVVDESLDQLDKLELVEDLGWSGVALKTGRGHSQSLLAYCWARSKNRYITMQDLTNPGLALVHSANMCSHFAISVKAFEHNSRQYIPHSGRAEIMDYLGIHRVKDGRIDLIDMKNIGIY